MRRFLSLLFVSLLALPAYGESEPPAIQPPDAITVAPVDLSANNTGAMLPSTIKMTEVEQKVWDYLKS